MANRTRPIRIEFCVSENEHRLIKAKMEQLGTKNMGAYLRKMAIDGYIIKVDYTQQKKLTGSAYVKTKTDYKDNTRRNYVLNYYDKFDRLEF